MPTPRFAQKSNPKADHGDFLLAGLVALGCGYSYSKLADKCGEGGWAFNFLRKIHKDGSAGSLSWALILGSSGHFSLGFGSRAAGGLPLPRPEVGFQPIAETRPMMHIQRKACVNLSREVIKQSPEYTEEFLLTRDCGTELHRHYDLPGYWTEQPASHEHSH